MWPNVLDKVKDYRRVTWAQLFEKSDVLGVDDKQLQIGLRDVGAHRAFSQGGHDEIVRQALIDVVGLDLVVVAVLDPSVAGSGPAPEPASQRTGQPGGSTSCRCRGASRCCGRRSSRRRQGTTTEVDDDEVALDDADADDAGLAGPELIAQQLGRHRDRRDRPPLSALSALSTRLGVTAAGQGSAVEWSTRRRE